MKDMKNMTKDQREWMEHKYHKIMHKGNFLFRAFIVNIVLVTLVWLLSLTGFYTWAMHVFTHFTPEESADYIIIVIGLWKVGGVLLFLVPALAAWWEACMFKKYLNK